MQFEVLAKNNEKPIFMKNCRPRRVVKFILLYLFFWSVDESLKIIGEVKI